MPKKSYQELEEENKRLKSLLVRITHDSISMEFYRKYWEPIVREELKSEMEKQNRFLSFLETLSDKSSFRLEIEEYTDLKNYVA